ncbi:unnamed protein product [Chironomus riparius]|uniref:Uncharacterized protein n=1 Tax=Chironomus riparius TaxID=315576 RepID=A0A9N9WSF9_9DIPT|nr:unnamed protein product [Chironomus riparius]
MSADKRNNKIKESMAEQMTAFLSLIFAVILISIIAIPQVLQALFRLIYCNRKNRKSIRGKLAIVTGAERENELMKFISLKLADLGCNLAIVGDNIKDEKEMNFINDLKNKEVDVKYFSVSSGNLQEIGRIYQSLVTEFGNIDMLINVPKLIKNEEVSQQSESKLTTELNNNFNSTMFSTLSIVDVMRNQKNQGHIVTISPTAGLSVIPEKYPFYSAFYSFMKSIRGFVDSARLGQKIQTTFILPCCITNGMIFSDFINKYLNFLPMTSQAVADCVVDAILNNEALIQVPSNLTNLSRLLRKLIF